MIDAKESIEKPEKELIEFRKVLMYLLKEENVTKEDFFESFLIAKDTQDRQKFYFDQVKDLLPIRNDVMSKDPPKNRLIERIHD